MKGLRRRTLLCGLHAAGVRAVQRLDAMAVGYLITTLIWPVHRAALRKTAQIVARAKKYWGGESFSRGAALTTPPFPPSRGDFGSG